MAPLIHKIWCESIMDHERRDGHDLMVWWSDDGRRLTDVFRSPQWFSIHLSRKGRLPVRGMLDLCPVSMERWAEHIALRAPVPNDVFYCQYAADRTLRLSHCSLGAQVVLRGLDPCGPLGTDLVTLCREPMSVIVVSRSRARKPPMIDDEFAALCRKFRAERKLSERYILQLLGLQEGNGDGEDDSQKAIQ